MEFLGYALVLLATTVVSIYWFSNILLPIFYGLPKAAKWCAKRAFSWWLLPRYVFAPVFWLVVPIIIGYVLAAVSPSILQSILTNTGFNHGQIVGLVLLLGSILFNSKTRADLRTDFIRAASRHALRGPGSDEFTAIHGQRGPTSEATGV
jgi:hypothetical protein